MLDTRDLLERKEELEQQVVDSYNETFDEDVYYEDIDFESEEVEDWKEEWLDEIIEISNIESLEDEIGSEFKHGVELINEDEFENYVKELLEDCGYIPRDFPSWIEIDWDSTANNVRSDYSEVKFDGVTYFYRA